MDGCPGWKRHEREQIPLDQPAEETDVVTFRPLHDTDLLAAAADLTDAAR